MDELIYKEQALSCFHCWIDKRGDVHEPDEIAAYRAIEALPSVDAEPRWIPCNERPPENKQECLLTIVLNGRKYVVDGTYSTDLYSVDKYDFADRKGVSGWYCVNGEYGCLEYVDNVVAWMPLPEVYNGGE